MCGLVRRGQQWWGWRLGRSCIAQNYAHIHGVERELADLQLQLKLTSGPRASALEMMRRKIEQQADKVITARKEHTAALKARLHRRLLLSAKPLSFSSRPEDAHRVLAIRARGSTKWYC